MDGYTQSGKVLLFETLIGTLTFDVICKVAFQLDMHSMDGSSEFFKIHDGIRAKLGMIL